MKFLTSVWTSLLLTALLTIVGTVFAGLAVLLLDYDLSMKYPNVVMTAAPWMNNLFYLAMIMATVTFVFIISALVKNVKDTE